MGNFYGHVKAVFEEMISRLRWTRSLGIIGFRVGNNDFASRPRLIILSETRSGNLNYQIEQARLKLRSLELQGRSESLESRANQETGFER